MQLPEKEWYTLKEVSQEWSCTINDLLQFAELQQLEICFRLPKNDNLIYYVAIFSSKLQPIITQGMINISVPGKLDGMTVKRDWCGISALYRQGYRNDAECLELCSGWAGCPENNVEKCLEEHLEEWFVLKYQDAGLFDDISKTVATVSEASRVYSDRFAPARFETKLAGMPIDAQMCCVQFYETPKRRVPIEISIDQLVILCDEFNRVSDSTKKTVSDVSADHPILLNQDDITPKIQLITDDKNPVWQLRMEALANEFKKSGKKHLATKTSIARQMSKEFDVPASTIERQTLKTW